MLRPLYATPRSGFTLTDVLVSMVLIVFLTGVALPGILGGNRETANRVKCASNLKQIGMAMLLYANDNNGNYPRTRFDVQSDKLAFYSHPDAKSPFAKDKEGVDANDLTAPLFLLGRTEDITMDVFVCPSSGGKSVAAKVAGGPDYKVQEHSNFPGVVNLSYSMQVPYPSKKAIEGGFKWNSALPADYALAADMNSGAAELTKVTTTSAMKDLQKANSQNHNGNGQNIMYADIHVEFQQTPFAGVKEDNIYTYGPSGKDSGGDGILGQPTTRDDNILLPTANEGKPPMPAAPAAK